MLPASTVTVAAGLAAVAAAAAAAAIRITVLPEEKKTLPATSRVMPRTAAGDPVAANSVVTTPFDAVSDVILRRRPLLVSATSSAAAPPAPPPGQSASASGPLKLAEAPDPSAMPAMPLRLPTRLETTPEAVALRMR